MNEKNVDNQMNFWMFLDKNKYVIIGFLIVLTLILLFRGYSIETPYFKVGRIPDTLFIEKMIELPPDTIYKEKIVTIEKPKIVTKYIEAKKEEVNTKVQKGDTIIEVKNQPANINAGTNNGIIGNENTVNIDVDKVQRKLDEVTKMQLVQMINIVIKEKKLDPNHCVQISSISDTEAFNFAKELESFLNSKQYNLIGGLGTFQRSPPIIGVGIGFDNDCIAVQVGFRPE